MSCNTSWLSSSNCQGAVKKCNGCGDDYCTYHLVGVQACRVTGGHVCSRACDTSAAFVQNCNGENYACPGCNYRFCAYHLLPVQHIGVLTGGHVCENTVGASVVDAALRQIAIPGVGTISDANEYIRHLSDLGLIG